jgi:hypothetical protein
MTMTCKVCGRVTQIHISRKDTAKYCSRQCHAKDQRGLVAWNKGLTQKEYSKQSLVLTNVCLNCGKPVHNKFCNHSCQTSYQNKQSKGVSFEQRFGVEKALVVAKKMSKSIQRKALETGFTKIGASVIGNIRRGKTLQDLYGKDHADKMREDIKVSLDGFRQTPEGIRVRRECSERGIQLALSGKEFSNTKKGYFQGVYFGSSLEEQFLQEIFRLFGSLENVKRNNTKIVPKGEGFLKTIPDYLMLENGIEIALIEVKSVHLLNRPGTYEKAEALFEYGQNQGIVAGYFTQDTLRKFEELQGNPEPRRLNSLLSLMEKELQDYVVSRKVQRLSAEDKEANKALKSIAFTGGNTPNDPLPMMEGEKVRHPMKDGEHNYA